MSTPPTPRGDSVLNALSVDVEDWYQVSAFDGVFARSDWDRLESRVGRNMRVLLDLFDRRGVKATFFTLGWVAERHPRIVAEAHAAGHEIASHGYAHHRVTTFDAAGFRADLERARAALEAAAPVRLAGYRAPSFSFTRETPWAWRVLADLGYTFSSSVFPVHHDHYGIPDFPRRPVRVQAASGRSLWELPMTTWRVLGRNVPASGGGWMRFLPPALVRHAIGQVNQAGQPAVLYLHPWEVDPAQPRVRSVSALTRFRHYVNLDRMLGRLDDLLRRFRWGPVSAALDALPAAAAPPAPAWTEA